jgi:hypothetical protein
LPCGTFSQSVLLAEGLDVRRIYAHLHEGVLDVHIPFTGAAALTLRPQPIMTRGDSCRGRSGSGTMSRSSAEPRSAR